MTGSGYRVAVISHRRPRRCAATLAMLEDGGVARDHLTVFVSDPDDLPAYAAAAPGWRIEPGVPGLAAQRNHVTRHYRAGQPLVCCDDDIDGLVQLDVAEPRLAPVVDVHSLFLLGFTEARRVGATLWGLYPTANAYYMTRTVGTGLRFCIGVIHGVINRPSEHLTCACKDDYERTLLRYETDGTVARLNWVAARHRYDRAEGGLADFNGRTAESSRADAEYLMRRWPGLVHPNRGRRSPYVEVVLRGPSRRRASTP